MRVTLVADRRTDECTIREREKGLMSGVLRQKLGSSGLKSGATPAQQQPWGVARTQLTVLPRNTENVTIHL